MSDEIKVSVVEFGDRANYQLQWIDPLTGRKKTKSSGVKRTGLQKDRDKALAKAGQLEAELRDGRYAGPSKTIWRDFTDRYVREALHGAAESTRDKVSTVFALIEEHYLPTPKRVRDLTAEGISRWAAELGKPRPLTPEQREKGWKPRKPRSPATIACYLRHLKAALRWAAEMKFIREAPRIREPKHDDGAKGRALLVEEYERMLMAVPKVIKTPEAVPIWRRFLEGLWWSGLRIGEALALSWDTIEPVAVVMLPGYRPALQFKPRGQKARRAELVPCAPEFAKMLEEIPEGERSGRVFDVRAKSRRRASDTVSAIGRAAGVVVNEEGKAASAHDFRRSFGTRWAKRIMPAQLKVLMRHKNISTTLKYYITQDAEDVAEDLWAAYERATSNSAGNTTPKTREKI